MNRYPGAPRRDYARYQFALCYDMEHEKPDRDQTATREAIEQYRNLIREFPDSGYAGAGRERIRQLTDLLAEHDFGVGYFYYRKGATASALARFTALEERFPDYGSGTSSTSTKPGRWTGSAEKRRPGATTPGSWRSIPRAITPRRRGTRNGAKEGEKPPVTAVTVDTKAQSQ